MFQDEIEHLLKREPFEPFRLKLVNGDTYDIFQLDQMVVLSDMVTLATNDQNWAFFPLDKVLSVESLFDDFQGELARHAAEQ